MSFLEGSVYDQFDDRITALEEIDYTGLSGRVSTLENRCNIIEGDITSLSSRALALETWRGDKSPSIANETSMPVSTTIGTAVITLGLNAPTAASIESNINTVKTEINAVKNKVNSILSALRTREIINA